MPAEFESGAFSRTPAWHFGGVVKLDGDLTAAEAIRDGRLDWRVEKRPLFYEDAQSEAVAFPDRFALVRDIDSAPLGVSSGDYAIDQNIEAFDWMDELLGEGCSYEAVMSLRGGRLVALLAHFPTQIILGEEHRLYVLASLWHDAEGASSLKLTDQRVVCMNTWNAAMSGVGSYFSYRHVGDLQAKRDRITQTLKMAGDYSDKMAMTASTLVQATVSRQSFIDIVNEVWPEVKDETARQKTNRLKLVEQFAAAVKTDDLAPFRGTAWAIMQAAADFDSHAEPVRKTADWEATRFINLMEGRGVQQTFLDAIERICGVTV